MRQELEAIARAIAQATITAAPASGSGKTYELWLIMKLAEELVARGYPVSLLHADGTVITTPGESFIQRGGPGYINPQAGKPGAVRFAKDGIEWEIHNSLEFLGRSNATHEVDICILSRAVADALRGLPQPRPARGHPLFAIECKHYSGDAGIAVSRALVGQMFDCSHWQYPACCANSWYSATDGVQLLHVGRKLKLRFAELFAAAVATSAFSAGATRLGTEYSFRIHGTVAQGTQTAADFITAAVDWIENDLA